MHFGYGTTVGALYAALRDDGGDTVTDGIGLGLGTWANGHIGWLPARELKPPVTEYQPAELASNLIRHALYGITTVAMYRQLREVFA